ncbi:MAG: hypothetical protein IT441_02580 [Phycisphaeraceae bacterium]|nr:hypothetical protein [Phycisphaeraceae bacterium]
MSTPQSTPRYLRVCLMTALAGLVLAACTSSPPTPGSSVVIAPDETALAEPRSSDPATTDPNDPQAAADAQARRLREALARLNEPTVNLDTPEASPQVLWLEPVAGDKPKASPPPPAVEQVAAAEPAPTPAETSPATEPSLTPEQQRLLDQLRAAMVNSSNPQMLQAIVAAASTPPPSPSDAEIVPAVHAVPPTPAAPPAAEQAIDAPILHIGKLELCKRVESFGVYDPIDTTSLLVGRAARMIVYVELDHFQSRKISEQAYRVQLTQEVTLYNEADGLAVWQQPAVQIQDESRNVRRDFFVVQVVELPARLSVGKYILKVRVTDQQSQTFDEATASIHIVADQSVAQGPTGAANRR